MDADAAKREIPLEDLDIVRGELLRIVSLIDDLGHADHVALVVTNWHAQYRVGLVAGPQVDFAVKSGVLK